jgi:hypothetical protein
MLGKKGNYDHTVDTYSMGLICLAISSKWNTIAELNKLYTNARLGIFPPELKTSYFSSLLAWMLCKDPETRKQACLLNEHDPGADNVPDIEVLKISEARSSPDPEVDSSFNLNPDPDLESIMEPYYDPEQDSDCNGADIEDTGMISHKGTHQF